MLKAVFFILTLIPLHAEEFRGYSAVNQTLQDRLLRQDFDFELGVYLAQRFEPGGLLDLMGTYNTGAWGSSGFHNGLPNSLNMLLWHLALSGLAKDVGSICTDEQKVAFLHDFLNTVKSLCQEPQPFALQQFYDQIMRFDAPEEERNDWLGFAQSPSVLSLSPREYIETLALTLFNHPYFLLRR